MSTPEFEPADESDVEDLAAYLASETWPWNVPSTFDLATARDRISEWMDDHCLTWWIVVEGERVGSINVESVGLDREAPVWDLRLREAWRSKGIGSEAVRFLTAELFTRFPDCSRVEAQTRQDNIAMRTVLRNCGYVQEACYRQGWPGPDGRLYDGIGYAILRHDWETGERTPVDWDGATPGT